VILCDVNVLVYAFRDDSVDHEKYRSWLTEEVNSYEPVGVSPLVLSSVVRLVTNRRVFNRPDPLADALAFCQRLVDAPNAVLVHPGQRHWPIFCRLCSAIGATGPAVPDAYLAALAMEHGCEWITTDRGFARFPGLKWRSPLDPTA
jgi:toxin-antitoxin system PIN domain toxin